MSARTAVACPDPDPNRQARLAWIAETLRLPLTLAAQGVDKSRRLRRRHDGNAS